MRIRTILAAAAAPATLAAVLLGTAGQASAATTHQPPQHVTGSVVLSGPAQFEQFNNIGTGPSGLGSVSYTNFTYASPGSGVWSLHSGITLTAHQGGNDYPHVLTIDSIKVTGLNSYTFTGHGDDPAWTSTGSVVGNQFTQDITFTDGSGYTAHDTGTIDANGGISGTLTDSLGQTVPWDAPAGSAFEVLSYTAPVNSVTFGIAPAGAPAAGSPTATFGFKIPATTSLPNADVTVNVTDGGNPGPGHDVYGHNGTSYQVIGGNLTVH